jgi:hypothetical protein
VSRPRACLVIFLSQSAVVLKHKLHIQVTVNGPWIWSDPLVDELYPNVDLSFGDAVVGKNTASATSHLMNAPKKDLVGSNMILT